MPRISKATAERAGASSETSDSNTLKAPIKRCCDSGGSDANSTPSAALGPAQTTNSVNAATPQLRTLVCHSVADFQ